jgi:mono/diheme cytochrome c family protein
MRFLLLFSFISSMLYAQSTFITKQEYASSLYKNPRGIGCGHCHGPNGEGKVIARYIHKKKPRAFVGPQINNVDFRNFYKALTQSKKGMPRYYLTQREIEALYFYLHQNDTKEDENAQ